MSLTLLAGLASVLLALALQIDKVAPIAAPLLRGNVSTRHVVKQDVAKLGGADTVVIFLCLLRRYANAALGRLRKLAFDVEAGEFILPEITIESELKLDDALIKRFHKAVGSDNEALEAQLLVWPAVTTPLMLLIMAHPRCPIMPLGAVNVSNTFRWLDIDACSRPRGRKLRVEAKFGGSLKGRRVKRGLEFDIEITCRSATDDAILFTQTITLLQFLKSSEYRTDHLRSADGPVDSAAIDRAQSAPQLQMQVAMKAPSLWAEVCRDYNPIHMSALAAKTFGFASKIGHGNHILALALVRAGRRVAVDAKTIEMHVAFRRPCLLPARVDVQSTDHALVVSRKGKNLVEATIR